MTTDLKKTSLREAEQTKATEVVMTTLEISNIMGMRHDNVLRKMKNLVDVWNAEMPLLRIEGGSYLDAQTQSRPMYVLNEKQARFVLCSFSPQLLLKVLKRYDELEAENKALREKVIDYNKQAGQVRVINEIRNSGIFSDEAIILMYKNLGVEGLPNVFTTSDTTASLTDCLKMWGVELTARAANVLLADRGLQFKDGKGKWCLTEDGKEFGKQGKFMSEDNQLHDTGIRWDYNRFDEVLDKIEVKHSETPIVA